MFRCICFLICFFSFLSTQAQFPALPNYPKGYFRNPLQIPISLSGNFGELRPNHYHMGLDLKTERRENLSVHAAADGYIARIKIEPGGFGRAIYVNHPNGFTTVYCHLNNFFPELEKWSKSTQYQKESWSLDEGMDSSTFPVKKGQLLAYSGNTGGSQAPHLHFEVRRTSDETNLNPIVFGFPLTDQTKPTILRVAIYDRNKSVYEQSPRILPAVHKGNGIYQVSPITVATNKISAAITTYDTHTGSSNLNGVFEAVLFDNEQPQVGFRMHEISYDATRYLNAHIDYKTKQGGGPYLQHLSELPGYINSIYTRFAGDGVVDLSDGTTHTLKIVVKDANGNAATVEVPVRFNGTAQAYTPPVGKRFYPLMLDIFESENCEFILGERSLYDSASVAYSSKATSLDQVISDVHTIGSSSIPLQDAVMVRIRPNKSLTPEEQSRVVMQRFTSNRKEVQRVSWQNEWAMAGFREFGSYQLVVDQEPPVITPIGFKDGANLAGTSRLMFTVSDNMGKWRVLRTELDGKWLRFTNDKGKTFIYQFDEMCPQGQHNLTIIAADEAGNETRVSWQFTR